MYRLFSCSQDEEEQLLILYRSARVALLPSYLRYERFLFAIRFFLGIVLE